MQELEIPYQFIAIEGNIGAGKTTFANKLAPRHSARLLLESFADNPFLPKFYRDNEKYAFPLELSFLAERYNQVKTEFAQNDMFNPNLVSDYFFLKSLVFARATLNEAEYSLFKRLFHIINDSLPRPDLLVYLYQDTEKLLKNIRKRGREYEQSIPAGYLEKVQQCYFDFMKQLPGQKILIADVSELDYADNEADFNRLAELLKKPYPAGITRIRA